MSKRTKTAFLPARVRTNLESMGEQIKLARKRRKLSISAISERAQCSELTVIRAERGIASVSIGVYARILYALGLHDDLLLIAKDDKAGNALLNIRLLGGIKHKKGDSLYDFA